MLTIRTPLGDEAVDLEEFEDRVRRGVIHPSTPVLFPPVAGNRWISAGELEFFQGLYDPLRIKFTRYFSLSGFPFITTALIFVNIFIFILMIIKNSGSTLHLGSMVDFGAKAPSLIFDAGETWRLITANFVHRDFIHLAFNMFVLFNVGGALENAFRSLHYLTILVAASLGTTLLSLAASDSISGGASGVAFGCLGGLVVFGIKYSEIIPRRYKRFFGVAVLPYVLLFLWMGWMSQGIDNWGHLGGLLGGIFSAAMIKPKLLYSGEKRKKNDLIYGTCILLIIGIVSSIGFVFPNLLRKKNFYRDDVSGVLIEYPRGWRRIVTCLGDLGIGNNLPDPVWIQARFEILNPPVEISSVADKWLREQLHGAERLGRIRSSQWRLYGETSVAGLDALEYEASFKVIDIDGRDVEYMLRLFAFSSGDLAYSMAMAGPVDRFRAYRPVLQDAVDSIVLDEPRFLRHARGSFLVDPGQMMNRVILEHSIFRAGEIYDREIEKGF